MSSSTSSPRRGGLEHSKSSDNSKSPVRFFPRPDAGSRFGPTLLLAAILLFCLSAFATGDTESFTPSKAAAARCRTKLDRLKAFQEKRKPGQTQTTNFTDVEINSYLAQDLSPQYHPCLKSLVVALAKDKLKATATIDIDRLGATSGKLMPKLIGLLFSGVHALAADGQLVAKDGKAHFKLEQALLDGGALPNPLVEAIISAIGRKQNPPFDPLQPTEMPYEINKVDVDSGYIIVFQ
jgi:hypothetical protein